MGIDWPSQVLEKTAHRPWALPSSPWVMTMSWVDLLAAHWPVDPEVVESFIPAGLQVDTFERQAWLSVLPFVMEDVSARGLTWWPRPMRFPELNLRTYVTDGADRAGIWFFSLDATSRLAVTGARTLFSLPYFNARIEREQRDGQTVYHSRRSHAGAPAAEFRARYRPDGPVEPAEPDTLDHWLMARYCLYTERGGQLLRVDVHHPKWPLQPAEAHIETNELFDAFELDVDGPPRRLHYAQRIDVLGYSPKRVDQSA